MAPAPSEKVNEIMYEGAAHFCIMNSDYVVCQLMHTIFVPRWLSDSVLAMLQSCLQIDRIDFDKVGWMVFEYCSGGDLATFLERKHQEGATLDRCILLQWFVRLIRGLAFIYSMSITHNDIVSVAFVCVFF